MATAARVRDPIVLVHGLCGYDVVRVGGLTLASYWPGIASFMFRASARAIVMSLTKCSA